MSKQSKKYYVVVRGRKPGLYTKWFGTDGAAEQVSGLPQALYKGFQSLDEAREWVRGTQGGEAALAAIDQALEGGEAASDWSAELTVGKVVIFTDGGCDPNPGPGGYGVVLLFQELRKELSGGFRLTTNNRMELTACIEGLKALKRALPVVLYSDSKYVVDGITLGWARRWRARGWYRTQEQRAENADLWAELLALTEKHSVEFRWVRGHTGIRENERCDQLATAARSQPDLPEDPGYPGQKNSLL